MERILVTKMYDLTAPQSIRGRKADLTIARKIIGWEPKVSLKEGLEKIDASSIKSGKIIRYSL